MPASARALVSVVVPVLNEEDNVRPFYVELMRVIDAVTECEWEIIFVDDGSRDGTLDVVRSLRMRDERVRAVQLSRNFGSHAALLAGLSHCRGAAAVIISVDLQDPPALIEEFVRLWRGGSHVVWGVRRTRDDPWSKALLAAVYYRIIRRIALPGFPPGGMDCGLFDRRVIDTLLGIPERNGYVFATVFWSGFRQTWVPYDRQARRLGVSKWPLGRRIKAAIDLIVSFSFVPIRFMSYVGMVICLLSLAYAGFVLTRRMLFGLGGPGWSSVMVAILFLGGVQLIMLSVLGEYLWRISEQVRGRPVYVVMDRVGFAQTPWTTDAPVEQPGVSGRVGP